MTKKEKEKKVAHEHDLIASKTSKTHKLIHRRYTAESKTQQIKKLKT